MTYYIRPSFYNFSFNEYRERFPAISFRLKERGRGRDRKKRIGRGRLPEREIKFKRSGSNGGSSALLNILISTRKVEIKESLFKRKGWDFTWNYSRST